MHVQVLKEQVRELEMAARAREGMIDKLFRQAGASVCVRERVCLRACMCV